MKAFFRKTGLIWIGLFVLGLAFGAAWWLRRSTPAMLPAPGSPQYEGYAEAFEVGTAALDVDRYGVAIENLTRAIEKIPQEPAAWANRGLLHLRYNEMPEAASDLKKAHELAPDSPEIEALLGLLAEHEGSYDEAVTHLRKSVESRPQDLAAKFSLAEIILKSGTASSNSDYQKLIEDILKIQPTNLKILIERGKIAAMRSDRPALLDTLDEFQKLAPAWNPESRKHLGTVAAAAAKPKPLPGTVVDELDILNNLLKAELGYSRDSIAVSPTVVGESLQQFLRLAKIRTAPDAPDTDLTFTPSPPTSKVSWDVCLPVWLTSDNKPVIFFANSQAVRRADGTNPELPFPCGPNKVPPTADGILAIDWNNDKRTDLLLAGAGGIKFWEQNNDGSFADVTAKTKLDAAILNGDYFGAWAADIEMDGDLDIILAPRTGPPLVLRNNGDGTFLAAKLFPGVENVRGFVWADFDNDGANDAAFLDANGQLQVFANERAAQFRKRKAPKDLGKVVAIATADVNDDGMLDLLMLRDDGTVSRLSDRDHGQEWDVVPLISTPWAGLAAKEPGSARLTVGDLDNNGMTDLVVSGLYVSRIWLASGPDQFVPIAAEIAGQVAAAALLSDNGRLSLVGVSRGIAVIWTNHSTKDYHWTALRPLAASDVQGDNRINSFGIGGEMELRSGSLIQKVPIASPQIHFGLGSRKKAQIVRIIWPNGYSQVEFPEAGDSLQKAEQRIKASCPFLFAWNGSEVQFVTDFLWSSPLGMYINGQDQGGFLQTQDWVKIRGDQLVPHVGYYDVRVAANLWETHFIDHLGLIVVDHPPETEIFVDERFSLTPMVPQVHLTGPTKPVAKAWDHHGTDVTEIVRTIDGRYLDTCGRGRYQGITNDHWVEVDLGDDAPRTGPLWLLANGWIHPTDSSINVAITQGKHTPPSPLVLEIPDGNGGWKASGPPIGFPAGKNKTVMIRLDGIDGPGVTRHFRIRTNMEIFWDALHYAVGLDGSQVRQQRPTPISAELHFRGIMDMTQANASSPELPHYDRVARTGQRWRDLIGYHTRYGDVRELLANIDDRYVIMNAGDEMSLRFPVPELPAGWKRDFVWVADGWVKDGDYNTSFSKTVLPLPAHGQKNYSTPPTRLEDDPVYQRFPDDWKNYHTRYVTPWVFEQGLRAFRRP